MHKGKLTNVNPPRITTEPIAGYGVYANQKSEVLSDLTLANVEALAGSGETTIECCLALWGTCKGDIKAPYVCASR